MTSSLPFPRTLLHEESKLSVLKNRSKRNEGHQFSLPQSKYLYRSYITFSYIFHERPITVLTMDFVNNNWSETELIITPPPPHYHLLQSSLSSYFSFCVDFTHPGQCKIYCTTQLNDPTTSNIDDKDQTSAAA